MNQQRLVTGQLFKITNLLTKPLYLSAAPARRLANPLTQDLQRPVFQLIGIRTADIPLASAVIEKGAFALDPRGKFYTKENIGEQLAIRNFMDEMRSSGITTSGPKPFGQSDRKSFANQLDKFLAKHNK